MTESTVFALAEIELGLIHLANDASRIQELLERITSDTALDNRLRRIVLRSCPLIAAVLKFRTETADTLDEVFRAASRQHQDMLEMERVSYEENSHY